MLSAANLPGSSHTLLMLLLLLLELLELLELLLLLLLELLLLLLLLLVDVPRRHARSGADPGGSLDLGRTVWPHN